MSEAVRIEQRGLGVLNSKSEYLRCSLPCLSIDVEEWRRKRLECEQVAKLATETGELEMVDIMVSKVAAEKGKISQVGDNRRKKKRKLEVLVNWGL